MATIASAKAKYARKTGPGSPAAQKYDAAKGRMTPGFVQGVTDFLGRPPSPMVVSAYTAGINAAQYHGGNPDKWERNLIAGLTGG